jgi:hypothetical protein
MLLFLSAEGDIPLMLGLDFVELSSSILLQGRLKLISRGSKLQYYYAISYNFKWLV